MHSRDSKGIYHYGPALQYGSTPDKHGYSMLISASFIIHKVYMELFHSWYMPNKVIQHIDSNMNCEDIAMCILVAKFLGDISWKQSAVLSVKPKIPLKNLEANTSTILYSILYYNV